MSIPQKYKNKKAILIATGPSLTEEVIETIRPYKDDFVIFGCNDTYKVVDFLDFHYACDKLWWDLHADIFREKYPLLEAYTQAEEYRDSQYNLTVIQGLPARGMSLDPSLIHWGKNSGYQLLNIAFLMGCRQFILVGYNMQRVEGQMHYFGDHPPELSRSSPYDSFVSCFNTIQPEIKELIINCTPHSALTMFKYSDLKETLNKGT
jgi:hypothetical protein